MSSSNLSFHSFSIHYNSFARQIISDIFVSNTLLNIPLSTSDTPDALPCKGLWDTGATNTVISNNIVDSLHLPIVSKTLILGVNGNFETSIHMIDLWLPNSLVIRRIPAIKGILTKDFDVLIGMDIISKGDFSISNFNGKTLFSFRSPSVAHTDYVTPDETSNKNKLSSLTPLDSGNMS